MENPHGKSVFDLDANLVALLCYLGNLVCMLGLILSIITVITDKKNKLARFHAWQSILLSVFPIVLVFVALILMTIGGVVAAVIDGILGFPIVSLIFFVVSIIVYILLLLSGLALLIGQIIAAVKGFGGELFKLPVIGKLADKYSG